MFYDCKKCSLAKMIFTRINEITGREMRHKSPSYVSVHYIIKLLIALLVYRRAARLMNIMKGLFGIRWQLHGRNNIKDKAYIMVSNHQSSIDVLGMNMFYEY